MAVRNNSKKLQNMTTEIFNHQSEMDYSFRLNYTSKKSETILADGKNEELSDENDVDEDKTKLFEKCKFKNESHYNSEILDKNDLSALSQNGCDTHDFNENGRTNGFKIIKEDLSNIIYSQFLKEKKEVKEISLHNSHNKYKLSLKECYNRLASTIFGKRVNLRNIDVMELTIGYIEELTKSNEKLKIENIELKLRLSACKCYLNDS
jgi:hypothetical protein